MSLMEVTLQFERVHIPSVPQNEISYHMFSLICNVFPVVKENIVFGKDTGIGAWCARGNNRIHASGCKRDLKIK